jgi:hypothetical protein
LYVEEIHLPNEMIQVSLLHARIVRGEVVVSVYGRVSGLRGMMLREDELRARLIVGQEKGVAHAGTSRADVLDGRVQVGQVRAGE